MDKSLQTEFLSHNVLEGYTTEEHIITKIISLAMFCVFFNLAFCLNFSRQPVLELRNM